MKKRTAERRGQTAPSQSTSVLEEILQETTMQESRFTEVGTARPIVGVLINDRDPDSQSRLLVRWETDGNIKQQWLSPIRGLRCEKGDKVLVQLLQDGEPPVVTGAIDTGGSEEQTEKDDTRLSSKRSAVVLSNGASLTVHSKSGQPLVEISQSESGPTLRILNDDLFVDLPGRLSLSAEHIKLTAKKGGVEITGDDDVIVVGKNIYLN